MTYNYGKTTKKIFASSIALLILFSGMYSITYAFADTENNFITVTNDNIKNDPILAKILENIEKSRKEFSDIQKKTNQEIMLDEKRDIAKNMLEQELKQMFKDNEEFTPLKAFNKFLKKVSDDDTKTIFQGLFDYQQEKVNSARNAMQDVFRNGGTLQDARNAYHEAAKIPRADMIQLVKELNIKAGFSEIGIQEHFDDKGKLPRFDDEQESIISFVDLTTSAKNVNSSADSTNIEDIIQPKDEDNTVNNTGDAEKTIMQKLLEEIQFLKNKIKELEKRQDGVIQQTVFEQDFDSIHFASWILDYSQGSGHNRHKISDIKSIPVNALNKPDSYTDVNNSLALGRQGQVTLGFSEPVTGKLIVYEASKEKNIRELAIVEVSIDGRNWTLLKQTQHHKDDSFVHEYGYDLSSIGCITHVRITDNASSTWGDGFDVDTVGASKTCTNHT